MSQFQENLQTDRRMDRGTDTPYFLGPFSTKMDVQKIPSQKLDQLVSIRGHVHLVIAVSGL